MADDSPAPAEPATPTTGSTTPTGSGRLVVIGVVVALVALVVAGIWYQSSQSPAEDAAGESTSDEADLGDVTAAPVDDGMSFGASDGPTVDLYVDYQCSHCADLEAVIGSELARLTAGGEVELVIRPVKFVSRASGRGAAALYCAAEADQAFAMHQRLLAELDGDFSPEGLAATAATMGIDGATFGACLRDPATTGWVDDVSEAARADGIASIPSVLVGGARLTDAQVASGPDFRDAVLGNAS